MALNAAITFECRDSGNAANGGGFKGGAAGTDYSLQDVAHISATDWQTKGGDYDRVYSVSQDALLTADCIGNVIFNSGGGSSDYAGFFEVIGQGNDGDNYLDVDRNMSWGNTNNMIAKLGGILSDPSQLQSTNGAAPGNIIYVKAGTYSSGKGATFAPGVAGTGTIRILGYNASRGDNPTGNDRPLIQCAAFAWDISSHNQLRNIRFTTTHANGIAVGTGSRIANCKSYNSAGIVGNAITLSHYATAFDCEAQHDNGRGISAAGYDVFVSKCYVHDCGLNGIEVAYTGQMSQAVMILDNIIENNGGDGIELQCDNAYIEHNTIDGNVNGIDVIAGNRGRMAIIYNNQISNNSGVGIKYADAGLLNRLVDYNNYYNNTGGDVQNVTKGSNAAANDPGYADRAGGNFSEVDDADALLIRIGVG